MPRSTTASPIGSMASAASLPRCSCCASCRRPSSAASRPSSRCGAVLALRHGGAVLDLAPEGGGAVARFCVDGIDVLRRAPPDTRDVLEAACFPLVPFANRIAHGTFTFAGETVRLPRNFGDHPHALHGQGWQSGWEVRGATADTALLRYEHTADAWPWDYTAE